jgi:hypothetical protein
MAVPGSSPEPPPPSSSATTMSVRQAYTWTTPGCRRLDSTAISIASGTASPLVERARSTLTAAGARCHVPCGRSGQRGEGQVPLTGTVAQLTKRARAHRRTTPSAGAHLEDGAKAAAAQQLRERQVAHGPGRILAAAVAPNDVPLKDLAGLGG